MAYFFNTFAGAASAENFTLEADAAGEIGFVAEVFWGGEVTTSTAMRTRWCRPTTAGVTFAAVGTVESSHPSATARLRFGTFTTDPVKPASPTGLYHTSWNAHGGLGRWLAAPGEEWIIIAAVATGEITCTNDVGTAAGTFGVGWRED